MRPMVDEERGTKQETPVIDRDEAAFYAITRQATRDEDDGDCEHTTLPPWLSRLDTWTQASDFETRYAPLSLIGRGGSSEVHLVQDRRIGREVAAKILRARGDSSDNNYRRFVLETSWQAQLEHPSIVPVHDIGITATGAPYFTMKRVRGMTLEQILTALRAGDASTRAKYSRRKLLTAFNTVCLTIAFAHDRGVIHRDIKPGNIMLGDFGETYVLDWGLAKRAGTRETTHHAEATTASVPGPRTIGMVGTPGYMAPEQVSGSVEEIGPATDIYALGATLFEILTLERLHDFNGGLGAVMASTLNPVDARASARAPALDVPPELEALCVRATLLDPAQRLSSARELSDAVEKFLDGDRDITMRRKSARAHGQSAEEELLLAERAETTEEETEHQRRAMQAIGKALALDADHPTANQSLARLLRRTPRELPAEVQESMTAHTRAARCALQKRGALIFSLIVGALVVVGSWVGVRDRFAFGALFVYASGIGLMNWMLSKRQKDLTWLSYVNCAACCVACLLARVVAGPLVVAPTILTITMMAFAMIGPSIRRFACVVCSLTLVVPVVAEALGVLSPSYSFDGGRMCIMPNVVPIVATPTLVMLTLFQLGLILLAGRLVGNARDALRTAEEQVLLSRWQLSQLLPRALGSTLCAPDTSRAGD